MGILDTLKKAISSTAKAGGKVLDAANAPFKEAQRQVDATVKPILQSFYDASKKRLDLEEEAKAAGAPVTAAQKALSYVPGVAMATNPRIEGELKALQSGKGYSGTDRAIDTVSGLGKAGGSLLSVAYTPATLASGAVGQATEKLTGKNLVDELSAAASSGSENVVKKAVGYIPGLSDDQRQRAAVGGGEFLKFAAELIGARLGGKVVEGKAGTTKLTAQQAAAAERFGLKPSEVESFVSKSVKAPAAPIRSAVGQAAGMAAADLALAQAADEGKGESGTRTALSAAVANVFPGGKGKKAKTDLADTVRKTKVVDPDAPEAAVVAKSFAKEDAARKASMPFKEAQAKIELAAEKATGVTSPTRSNPAYAEFWKKQDEALSIQTGKEVAKKETAPTEDDYYSAVEAPKAPAPIKARLDKAIESKKKPVSDAEYKAMEDEYDGYLTEWAKKNAPESVENLTGIGERVFKTRLSDEQRRSARSFADEKMGKNLSKYESENKARSDKEDAAYAAERAKQDEFDAKYPVDPELAKLGFKTRMLDDGTPELFESPDMATLADDLRAAGVKDVDAEISRLTEKMWVALGKDPNETVKVYSSQDQKYVDQKADGGGVNKGMFASPKRSVAEGYFGENRDMVSMRVPRKFLYPQDPDVFQLNADYGAKAETAKTDRQVVSAALNKAVAASKPVAAQPKSTLPEGSPARKAVDEGFAKYDAELAAEAAAAKDAPVAPFEVETEKPKVKPQSYDATKATLDAKDVDMETVKTARPVKGTTSVLGTTSVRTLFNKVRIKGKDGLERGLGDVLVAIVDGRYNEAMRNMEASGLKTDADVAIANYLDDNRPFRESIDGMIGAMRGPKLRDVKVGPEKSALTYGEWADVFDAERNSQDRSWMMFGDNARQDAARDIAILDAMYDRLSRGPSAAVKARDAYAKGVVGDTLMNVKIAAKNAADSMGAAGGDWMVQNNLLADYKLDPEYRHDYVPESLFQRYKKSLLASGKLDKESAKALDNMDYQRFVSNDYDLASLSDTTVQNLSPLLQDKKNAKFLHMPGDFARAVHQADRLAALKQNKSAYDLANGVQATPQGEGIKNVWKGGMKGLLSLGDQTGRQVLGETPFRAVNAAGKVVHNFITPFLYIFGKGKLLAQAAFSGAAVGLGETAMNPVRALVNSLTQNPLKQLGLTPGNKLTAALRDVGLIERPVNSRASGFEKVKSFGFAFGGKPFDNIAKTFAAYKAIQEVAGKNMTVDQAAAWFSRKMKDGTPSERAQVMSDVGGVVSRISDHTTGSRSGQPWLNSVWMGTLKSFQRNQHGRYLNAIQNAYDALLAKESPKLSPRERARAVRELAYPAAVIVGGPLMAGAALLAMKEAAKLMGVPEDELPEDDVLIETGFNTYNMSTANGYGPMALEFLLNDAVSTLRPSGVIAIVDKAVDAVGAARKLMDGDVRGAAAELLKGGIASRLADTGLGKDVKGYERGYGSDVASRLGLPTTSAANANLFRSQFARDFYGDRSYLAAIENAGKKILPKMLQDFVGNKYSQPGSAEEKAEMEDLKTAAAQEFVSFVKSGERKNFTQFLRDFLPPAVIYDPVDFAEIMAGRQIDRVEEGGAISRLLGLMPQSMRGVAYVGDVGEYFRKLGETDPQALEQFAGAVAGLVAEAKKNAAEGRLNKDVEGDFRKGFVDPASSAVVAEFTGEDPASTDPSNKFSNLARKIVGDLKGERDQAVVREGVAKLDSLVARAKADPNFWKAVGTSIERVVSEAMFGNEGGQVLDFVKANGEDFPALDEALRGRYKYLSGPAGDAMYAGEKPEAAADTTSTPADASGTKKPTDITSLLNSAIWSASEKKGDKKSKQYVPVPTSKKSASRPSTPSASSRPSGRISEALYKAIGSRPRK